MALKTLILLASSLAVSFAQPNSVAGDWAFKMETPSGDIDVAMTLKVDGTEVSGTLLVGADRKLPIEKGSIDGKVLKLVVKRERPQGGSMTYELSGTVEGSSIKGTMVADIDGEKISRVWNAAKK